MPFCCARCAFAVAFSILVGWFVPYIATDSARGMVQRHRCCTPRLPEQARLTRFDVACLLLRLAENASSCLPERQARFADMYAWRILGLFATTCCARHFPRRHLLCGVPLRVPFPCLINIRAAQATLSKINAEHVSACLSSSAVAHLPAWHSVPYFYYFPAPLCATCPANNHCSALYGSILPLPLPGVSVCSRTSSLFSLDAATHFCLLCCQRTDCAFITVIRCIRTC